ncbi:MAG: tetratricopeptide repeat protein, partial [Sphingomonas bacterium]|nr:tetratricopeptide repeat protein [Sphingomonas bacterium]
LGGGNAVLFKERAVALHGLGDVAGAVADRTRVIAATPWDAVALAERGAEYLWLGRFAEAQADLDHADRLAGDDETRARVAEIRARLAEWRDDAAGDAAAACRAAGKARHYGTPHLVATCSAAFFAATAPAERATLLDIRARAWSAGGDADNARADWQMATAIAPQDARWQADLGFADVAAGQHQAAKRAFDRALAVAPDDAPALAGRAAANYSLRALRAAYVDAKRSVALSENAAAYVVLGDIANDRHDTSMASDYWLRAYRLGEHSEDLLARLQDVGIDEPDDEPDGGTLPGSDAPTV